MSERPRKQGMKLPHPDDFLRMEILDVGARVRTGVADPTGVFHVLRLTVVVGVPFLIGREEAMGWLVRRWEQSQEGRGQVGLGMRQEPWAGRGRRQVARGGCGRGRSRDNALWHSYPSSGLRCFVLL